MKEALTKVLQFLGLAFWVEIVTDHPHCTYYFGPFSTQQEAAASKAGYVEDLETEGALGILVNIKRCKPTNLTIFDESADQANHQGMTSFSGQPS